MFSRFVVLLAVLVGVAGCSVQQQPADELVHFTILQLNDVYEISPLEGGKAGGLARVATIKQELLKENPNTIAVLAGDFLSPSFTGTLKMDNGEPVAGLQMVETLNAMGLDYATFGNHEFDLKDPNLLQQRIDQSKFRYTVCNALRIREGVAAPFLQGNEPIPSYLVHEFDGVRVALVGVVLPFNRQAYVQYLPVEDSFREACRLAARESDVVLGLTHLSAADDKLLAATTPQVPLFMGGHDHNNMGLYVEQTVIAKADANAKTVYIHRISHHRRSGLTRVRSTLRRIDDTIPMDPATQAVVERWEKEVFSRAEQMGYQPRHVVMHTREPLECTETIIRGNQTNYGRLALEAMREVLPGADVYWINSGSMRLDDRLSGAVTEFDVLRTFPYGGKIVAMDIPGSILEEVMQISMGTNRGEGGYFQVLQVSAEANEQGRRQVDGQDIDPARTYRVVMPQFVAEGKEANLSVLGKYKFTAEAELLVSTDRVRNDIRDIVIRYMRQMP
jgi:2',3'-cyclic-nucleotide 2'-phosphodiesterase (5'-nucleotidase family)